MITAKEIGHIILGIIIFAFAVSAKTLFESPSAGTGQFLIMLIFGFIIISVYVLAKKLVAYYYEVEIEMKIWQFKRYGLYERSYFKNPVPIGIILPFLLSILTFGYVKWLGILQSQEKATTARAAKRHDFYSYSELTEWHIGLISASGIVISLILAILAYFINQPELAKLSIYYAVFNLIPLGQLDGTKVFFGSKILWTILAAITAIILIWAGFVIF